MKRQKVMVIGIIIVVVCIFLFKNEKNLNGKFEDELIFFKLFSLLKTNNRNEQNTKNQEIVNYQQYVFKVAYKNIDFKEIHLADTINKETLIHEKIAPGTKGAFEIFLETNQKTNYQIYFKSKNKKPKNLNFQIKGRDRKYKNLEDMEQELKGEIRKSKAIVIDWEWEYHKRAQQDLEDTQDGEKIKKFEFSIYAIAQ